MKNDFISKYGSPDESFLLYNNRYLSIHYKRGTSKRSLSFDISSNPSEKIKETHWKYEVLLNEREHISNKLFEKSDQCVSDFKNKNMWPYNGDCVSFINTGSGLLNNGNRIVTTGRVTMKAGSYVYVRISIIDGADNLYVDGKYYHSGDEIRVPKSEIKRCN